MSNNNNSSNNASDNCQSFARSFVALQTEHFDPSNKQRKQLKRLDIDFYPTPCMFMFEEEESREEAREENSNNSSRHHHRKPRSTSDASSSVESSSSWINQSVSEWVSEWKQEVAFCLPSARDGWNVLGKVLIIRNRESFRALECHPPDAWQEE